MNETTPLIGVTVVKDTDKTKGENCPICYDDETPMDNTNSIALPCDNINHINHPLHKKCLLEIIEHNRNTVNTVSCPMCRKEYSYMTNSNYNVSSGTVWYVLKYNLMIYYLMLITLPLNTIPFILAVMNVKNSSLVYVSVIMFILLFIMKSLYLLRSYFTIKWAISKNYNLLRYNCHTPYYTNMTSYLVMNLLMPILYTLAIFFPGKTDTLYISAMACTWIDAIALIGVFSVIFTNTKYLSGWLDTVFASKRKIVKEDLDNIKMYLCIPTDCDCDENESCDCASHKIEL